MKNINENILNSKYKLALTIKSTEINENLNCILELNTKNLILKFKQKKTSDQTIMNFLNFMAPIYCCETVKEKILSLNFSLIEKLFMDETNKIILNIINPVFKKRIKIIINTIEKCNFFLTAKLKNEKIVILIKTINELIEKEKCSMLDRIFYFTKNLLNISNGKCLGNIYDNESLIKALIEGKKYYDKSIKELIKQENLRISVNNKIQSESFYFKNENYFSVGCVNIDFYYFASFDCRIQNIKECFRVNINEIIELFLDLNLIDKKIIDKGKDKIFFLVDKQVENYNNKNNDLNKDLINKNKFDDNKICDFMDFIYFGSKRKKSDFFATSIKKNHKSELVNEPAANKDSKSNVGPAKKFEIKFNLFNELSNPNKIKVKFSSSILHKKSNKSIDNLVFNKQIKILKKELKLNNSHYVTQEQYQSSLFKLLSLKFAFEKTQRPSNLLNKTHFIPKNRINYFGIMENKLLNKKSTKKQMLKSIKIISQTKINQTQKEKEGVLIEKEFKENQDTNYNSEQEKLHQKEILKIKPNNLIDKINLLKSKHLFSVNNSIDEIFNNTIEVITRKYFEFLFEEFFEKTFLYQKDNNGFLKMDSLLSLFFYIRGIKYVVMQDNLQKDYIEFLETEFDKNKKTLKA